MNLFSFVITGALVLFPITTIYCASDETITSARIESCPGCSLNRLPEVKKFIYEDIPLYNIEFKKIHGAVPELVLLNNADEEIERIPLSKLNREECNKLLVSKGFTRKTENNEKHEF